jgi:hypothetical protein
MYANLNVDTGGKETLSRTLHCDQLLANRNMLVITDKHSISTSIGHTPLPRDITQLNFYAVPSQLKTHAQNAGQDWVAALASVLRVGVYPAVVEARETQTLTLCVATTSGRVRVASDRSRRNRG